MATYADGTTEAMIGDVVECIHGDDLCGLIYGWSYVATPATEDQVFLKGRDNEVWKSSRFKLISRAPSPVNAEPRMAYASGQSPVVGDMVRCENGGLHRVTVGQLCTVSAIRDSYILLKEGDQLTYSPGFFTLMYPQPNETKKAEPLVKWPEEKRLTWPKLEVGEWFAFDREGIDDAACLRVADGYVAMFSAGTSNAILPESRDYRVRRLRMIQPPKFEVI